MYNDNANFKISSELICNYKLINFLKPENDMKIIWDGSNLLFSIGMDGALYLTAEVSDERARYARYNLSQSISDKVKNDELVIRKFSVIKKNNKYLLAAVVSSLKETYIYISNEKDVFTPIWREVKCDSRVINENIYQVYTDFIDDKYVIMLDCLDDHQSIVRYSAKIDMDSMECYEWSTREYRLKDDKTRTLHNEEERSEVWTWGEDGLYFYDTSTQENKNMYHIVKCDKFKDVNSIYVNELSDKIYVYAYTESGEVFYCFANKYKKTDSMMWSMPITLMKDISYFYKYTAPIYQVERLIAITKDGKLIIGENDKDTIGWEFEKVDIPGENSKCEKFSSFTTKISVCDENNKILPYTNIKIRANKNSTVYINGKYYVFNDKPLWIKTNSQGSIKIIEKEVKLQATKFEISLDDGDSINVVPDHKVINKILNFDSVDKLQSAYIEGPNYIIRLIPERIIDTQLDVVAKGIAKLKKAMDNIHKVHTLDRSNECQAINRLNVDIEYTLDEIALLIKDKDYDFWIKDINDDIKLEVEINNIVYQYEIDSVGSIIECIYMLFNFIGVDSDKINEFISYKLDWDDILRGKEILETLFNKSFNKGKSQILQVTNNIDNIFDNMESEINEWLELDLPDVLKNKTADRIFEDKYGIDITDVGKSFLIDHFIDNVMDIKFIPEVQRYCALAESLVEENLEESLFTRLAEKEISILDSMINRLKDEVFTEDFLNKDFYTLVNQVRNILPINIMSGVKELVNEILGIIPILIEVIKDTFFNKVYIPIVSEILEEELGCRENTILDMISLMCGSIAIPTIKQLEKDIEINENESLRGVMLANITRSITKCIGSSICQEVVEEDTDSKNQIREVISGIVLVASDVISLAGDLLYSSYNNPIEIQIFKTIFKYISLIAVGINKIYPVTIIIKFQVFATNQFKKCADIFYGIGNIVDIILNSILISRIVEEYEDGVKDEYDYEISISKCCNEMISDLISLLSMVKRYSLNKDNIDIIEIISKGLIDSYISKQIRGDILTALAANV